MNNKELTMPNEKAAIALSEKLIDLFIKYKVKKGLLNIFDIKENKIIFNTYFLVSKEDENNFCKELSILLLTSSAK